MRCNNRAIIWHNYGGKNMKEKLFGIIVCIMLFATVLPVSGLVIVEKNTMLTFYRGSLSGYVNDTSMDPIERALIRIYFHGTYEEDYTDSLGYYHVTNIPICYCLKNCTASKEGYNPDWTWMGITEDTTHDFVLTPQSSPRLDSPYGPTKGLAGVDYIFSVDLPDDPECEPYFVMWDWGDGTNSDLIGPYPAGETVCANHTWTESGDYDLRVKIRDGCGNEYWSDPWTITMVNVTELDIEIRGRFPGVITVVIRNVGNEIAYDVNFSADVIVKGIVFGLENTHSNGTVEALDSGDSVLWKFSTGPLFGSGWFKFIVTADAFNTDELIKEFKGLILLFFVIIV